MVRRHVMLHTRSKIMFDGKKCKSGTELRVAIEGWVYVHSPWPYPCSDWYPCHKKRYSIKMRKSALGINIHSTLNVIKRGIVDKPTFRPRATRPHFQDSIWRK
jgi:hypothetical protein